MKKLIGLGVVLLTLLSGAPADAQSKPKPGAEGSDAIPLKIAILDLDAIRRQSIAVKDIRDQITGYRKGFQADIQKEEDALRSANQELAKKRTILSSEAFAKERRQFEQKVISVQKLVQKSKLNLDRAQAKAMLALEKKLNAVISDIADKQGVSIVMQRRHIILVARNLDITNEVLTRLNAELKKVPVEKPGSK
ncbi:MAG: OmpH family outer membrane protein [Rhodospirillaceae bacterium]|nr:OmpH family outer membrane protein [Rhodospirillaceae bacterium]